MRLPMSWLGKVALVMVVLAGLPIGMPMASWPPVRAIDRGLVPAGGPAGGRRSRRAGIAQAGELACHRSCRTRLRGPAEWTVLLNSFRRSSQTPDWLRAAAAHGGLAWLEDLLFREGGGRHAHGLAMATHDGVPAVAARCRGRSRMTAALPTTGPAPSGAFRTRVRNQRPAAGGSTRFCDRRRSGTSAPLRWRPATVQARELNT
jgi:hypothetical protein